MTSFLSDKNIHKLQYELRQLYPENQWVKIQSSVRDSARVWFSQHTDTLQMVYQRDGLNGLNKKFIGDMMASAEYFDNTNEPAYAQDQLFDTEISDPNIVADQPMPYVTGIENPMFTFSTFSKTYGANGEPETKYVYRRRPSDMAGTDPGSRLVSHTLTGPGTRRGPNKFYGDYQTSTANSFNPGLRPGKTMNDRLSTGDSLLQVGANEEYNITDHLSVRQGFDSRNCEGCQLKPVPPRYTQPRYPQPAPAPKPQSPLDLLKRLAKPFEKLGFGARVSREDARYGYDYGSNMKKSIYNTDQSKFFPNAYPGYQLGSMVDEYDSENGRYIPYPNNVTTNVAKTLNQLQFGDVPVVTEMSKDEIAVLGHQLHRQKDRPKRQRAPAVDGCGIPRREYIELHDDYPTNQVRAKFHLDQIYNTPESRINTIMDPVMGKTAMWQSQERSMLEIPCSSMDRAVRTSGGPDYSRARQYPDGYADSLAVPGCGSCNSEPRRQAYPTRDFVPTLYTTTYGQI